MTLAAAMGGINAAESAPVAISGTFTVHTACDTVGCTGTLAHVDTMVTGFFDPVAATFGVSSTTTFPFGLEWTVYDGVLFGPGTYTFSTMDNDGPAGTIPASGPDVTFTVNPGEIGGRIKFASGANSGVDIFLKWDGTGASLDFAEDLDGDPGYAMVDGPFPGYNFSFDLSQQPSVVPLPAAVWLFGSGLLGLIGVARRKKNS